MVSVFNNFVRFPLEADSNLLSSIDNRTSYAVQGARYTPQFKAKVWDGRTHFLKKVIADYILPTGLLSEISDLLSQQELVDCRRQPKEKRTFSWGGPELRKYQLEAVETVLRDRGLLTGKGMINLPIRSGKTLIAAAIIAHLGYRSLFVVQSKLLLHQTVKSFEECLKTKIGVLGDSICRSEYITVATVQSLIARPEAGKQLLRECDVLIFDECHHAKGQEWGKFILRCDAYYKVGLSATIFMDPDRPNESSAIWFRAVTGPLLTRVSPSRLIDEGYLFAPTINIYPILEPKIKRSTTYQKVYRQGIESNDLRNKIIAELAKRYVAKGMRVLIDTGRHAQVNYLCSLLKEYFSVAKMTGRTAGHVRKKVLERFRKNEVNCIVGTVLGEGVDIPELEVVINAEGQKSRIATVQRMRNLTACSEKQSVIFIDFLDKTHHTLKKHSEERVAVYRSYRRFKVNIFEGINEK